jgi:hypothetical protein
MYDPKCKSVADDGDNININVFYNSNVLHNLKMHVRKYQLNLPTIINVFITLVRLISSSQRERSTVFCYRNIVHYYDQEV